MFNRIIDPNNGASIEISSKRGIQILKKYINLIGGHIRLTSKDDFYSRVSKYWRGTYGDEYISVSIYEEIDELLDNIFLS